MLARVIAWLCRIRVQVLDWPCSSPDLFPTENVWRKRQQWTGEQEWGGGDNRPIKHNQSDSILSPRKIIECC